MNTRTLLGGGWLVVGVLAAGCTRPAESPAVAARGPANRIVIDSAQRSRFRIERAETVSFSPTITTTGSVQFSADASTQVLAPVSGPIQRILVTPGARVTAGQPLALVSSPDFAAAVAEYRKAAAGAKNAQHIADLDEQLFRNDALARRELEQAQTDAAAAAADRDAALDQLRALGVDSLTLAAIQADRAVYASHGVIRAPISGIVVERMVTPGQLVQAGTTPCFTIADLSVMWVMANVFERDIQGVRRGAKAVVTTEASPEPFPGVVDYVAAIVDPASKATAVRLLVPNRGEVLKRDMLVQVTIRSPVPRTGLLVPVAAVLRDDENLPFLFVAKDDGSFARRRIELGGRVGDREEVTGGLAPGERIVVDGSLFLLGAGNQ